MKELLASEAPDPQLLEAVLKAAAGWRQTDDPEVMAERVAESIRPYLGSRATESLVGAADADRMKLLTEIEPVLGLFLGRRAAALLVTRILNRALVRS